MADEESRRRQDVELNLLDKKTHTEKKLRCHSPNFHIHVYCMLAIYTVYS
jgi:hypothetical protein